MFKQKVQKYYSYAVKQKIVKEVESGKYTKAEAAKLYGVSTTSISNWMKRISSSEQKDVVVKDTLSIKVDRIKELEEDKRALEVALGQAYLRVMNLESIIEVIEKEYGIDAKKKVVMR